MMATAMNAAAPPIPAEVLRYWRSKGIRPGFSWQDVYGEEHHHAFTAAKLMREDVLAIVREELDSSFAEGRTYESFVRGLRPRLEAAGFWGEQQVTDPVTGDTVTIDVPTRLRRIYDTNMRTARAAGQWDRIQRTTSTHPYLLYMVGPSVHHREEHLAWHGLCLPVSDPFWEAHFPPNGYGCKCNVRSVSEDEFHRLKQDGIREAIPEKVIGPDGRPTGHIRDRRVPIRTEAPPIEMVEWTNQRTGETRLVPRGVTPGFDRPPNVRTIGPRGMTPPPAPAAPAAPAAPTPPPMPERDASRGQVPVAESPEHAVRDVLSALRRPERSSGRAAELRGALRRLVQTAHPDLGSIDLMDSLPARDSMRIRSDLRKNVLGEHGWDGVVNIQRARHAAATEAADVLAVGGSLSDEQKEAIRTHVHEEVHGHSPIMPRVYSGHGRVVEELTTELIARDVLVRAGIWEPSDVARLGAYSRYVDGVLAAMRRHVPGLGSASFDDLVTRVVDAGVKIRARGRRYATALEYSTAFADAVGVPTHARVEFVDEVRRLR